MEARQTQKQPKFKVGDNVTHPKSLYNEYRGAITEVEKIYQAVNDDGSFDMDGLATLEHTIEHICIPYEFDGETLTVNYPASEIKTKHGRVIEDAHSRVAKFYGYAYTVKTKEMLCVFSEEDLKMLKPK